MLFSWDLLFLGLKSKRNKFPEGWAVADGGPIARATLKRSRANCDLPCVMIKKNHQNTFQDDAVGGERSPALLLTPILISSQGTKTRVAE
jgi:hypothetical protein